MQLRLQFHLRAILKADDFARQHGFNFAYVVIPVPQPDDRLYETILARFCERHAIAFFSLRDTFEEAQRAGADIYLPRDGHLNARGAPVTALALADHFPLGSPRR